METLSDVSCHTITAPFWSGLQDESLHLGPRMERKIVILNCFLRVDSFSISAFLLQTIHFGTPSAKVHTSPPVESAPGSRWCYSYTYAQVSPSVRVTLHQIFLLDRYSSVTFIHGRSFGQSFEAPRYGIPRKACNRPRLPYLISNTWWIRPKLTALYRFS